VTVVVRMPLLRRRRLIVVAILLSELLLTAELLLTSTEATVAATAPARELAGDGLVAPIAHELPELEEDERSADREAGAGDRVRDGVAEVAARLGLPGEEADEASRERALHRELLVIRAVCE
jgi:hypothetical protein